MMNPNYQEYHVRMLKILFLLFQSYQHINSTNQQFSVLNNGQEDPLSL